MAVLVTGKAHCVTGAFSFFKHDHPSTSLIYIYIYVQYLSMALGRAGLTRPGLARQTGCNLGRQTNENPHVYIYTYIHMGVTKMAISRQIYRRKRSRSVHFNPPAATHLFVKIA